MRWREMHGAMRVVQRHRRLQRTLQCRSFTAGVTLPRPRQGHTTLGSAQPSLQLTNAVGWHHCLTTAPRRAKQSNRQE